MMAALPIPHVADGMFAATYPALLNILFSRHLQVLVGAACCVVTRLESGAVGGPGAEIADSSPAEPAKPAVRTEVPHPEASAGLADELEPVTRLTGNWQPMLRGEAMGVMPFAEWTGEYHANVAGGVKRSGGVKSLLDFGVELDTEKLGWWRGGTVFAQGHWVANSRSRERFSGYTGAFNAVSNIEVGDHLRVYNFYYAHSWPDDRVHMKVGQLAADDDFMGSDYATLLNSAFGAMPSQVGTPLANKYEHMAGYPVFPVASPGVFARVRPLDSVYTQAGLYYGQPGFDTRSNHGFDWARQSPVELGIFWESGYVYQLGWRPAKTSFGLSYHTGPVDDFRVKSGDHPSATKQTAPNFYLIQDAALVQDSRESTKLGAFVRVGTTTEPGKAIVHWYVDAGFNWFGPLPQRDKDVVSVGISHTDFGKECREVTGLGMLNAAGETTLEATYSARVLRWLVLQADVQWILNPAWSTDAESSSATVLGLRAKVTF